MSRGQFQLFKIVRFVKFLFPICNIIRLEKVYVCFALYSACVDRVLRTLFIQIQYFRKMFSGKIKVQLREKVY